MKLWIPVLTAAAMVAGCQADPAPAPRATSPTVLDVSAPRASYQPSVYMTPSYAPAPTPVAYGGPTYLPPSEAAAYVPPASAVASEPDPQITPTPHLKRNSSKSTYIVKQGDTLYHIARERYGDGKKWRQIAAANPDVSPTALRVGQKLVMP